MGIQGLLPLLKSVTEHTHVRNYAQLTFGVDAYVWLHRGAIACAQDLAMGKPTTKYVDYVMHRVQMLQHYGVKPYLVFDGDYLPSKAKTETERASRREENTRSGMEALAQGNSRVAQEFFQKAIDITPDMALRVIQALQKENFEYVVAPYEADAQLAYMEKIGLIDGVITEDSDLLVFGCKRVLFKLNEFGECTEIKRERLPGNIGLSFVGWNDDMFRYMAILSGCDYLSSLPGMGLKTAHRLVRKYKTINALFRCLRIEYGLKMPTDYEEKFRRADHTFNFQMVFCPVKKTMVMWNEPLGHLDEESQKLIGARLDDETARAVADGSIDPITKKPIVLRAVACAGITRPVLRQCKSAPAGNMRLDSFLVPRRPDNALQLRDVNIPSRIVSLHPTPKRTPPRLSVNEAAHAKKLKLFESSPDRLQTTTHAIMPPANGKASVTSKFFSPKRDSPRTLAGTPDEDFLAAIEASKADEATRISFEGFENPIRFQALYQQSDTVRMTEVAKTPVPPVNLESEAAYQTSEHVAKVPPETPSQIGLPSPPNSQALETLVSSWKTAYEYKEGDSFTASPTLAASESIQFSSSLRRLGGQIMAKRAPAPVSKPQRQPFTPTQDRAGLKTSITEHFPPTTTPTARSLR